jgi:hypothetical protein
MLNVREAGFERGEAAAEHRFIPFGFQYALDADLKHAIVAGTLRRATVLRTPGEGVRVS